MARQIELKVGLRSALVEHMLLAKGAESIEAYAGRIVLNGLTKLAVDAHFREEYPAFSAAHASEPSQKFEYDAYPDFEKLQETVRARHSISNTKAVREAILREAVTLGLASLPGSAS